MKPEASSYLSLSPPFSEKLQELGAIQAGGADDLVERSLGQVAAVLGTTTR